MCIAQNARVVAAFSTEDDGVPEDVKAQVSGATGTVVTREDFIQSFPVSDDILQDIFYEMMVEEGIAVGADVFVRWDTPVGPDVPISQMRPQDLRVTEGTVPTP